MARALAALPEDQDSIPNTHMVAHNPLQFQEMWCPLLDSMATKHTCSKTHMQSNTHTHRINKPLKEKEKEIQRNDLDSYNKSSCKNNKAFK